MARILQFSPPVEAEISRISSHCVSTSCQSRSSGQTAEIIIFTGVRFERLDQQQNDTPETTIGPKSLVKQHKQQVEN